MFHPIDTGPFKLVVVVADRLDQSSSAIPIFETGARLSDGIEHTIFGGASAAFGKGFGCRPGASGRRGNGAGV
jgi:hypothetical protein